MALEGWGREAQERLKASKVLIAGAGALASTTALYLAAGGVGAIRMVDESRVTLEDLGHPLLFHERDLGKARATVAGQRLKEINPFVMVEGQARAISSRNLASLVADCHLLIDAAVTSKEETILHHAAHKFRLPLVHARVWNMNGHLTTLWPGKSPCLTCAFPEPSPIGQSALLGPVSGILGALQACEALSILAGQGPAWVGRILTFKGDTFNFAQKETRADPQCPVCQSL